MPIKLTCDCGRTLNLKDELAGKRIKCPSCQESLLVSAEESGSSVRKQKTAKANGAKKGGGGMILAILGAGVLVLGCCCFSGTGLGAWWFWPGGSASALEKKIVGKWVSDIEPPKKGTTPNIDAIMNAGAIEFKADGTVIDASPMTPILQGKWKTVSAQSDSITVELSHGPIAKKLDIKVESNDKLKITPADSKKEYAFKRAP